MNSKLEGIMRSRFPRTYQRIQKESKKRDRRKYGPVTPEGRYYSKPQTYTKEEYLEEVVEPAIKEYEETIQGIDPSGTYVFKDKWGQDTFVSGETLISKYKKDDAIAELKRHKKEVEQLHPRTVFKEKDKGYVYYLPVGTIEKEKYESLSGWEKGVTDFFAPFSQLFSGVGSVITRVTGGAISITPPGDKYAGESLLLDVGSVSPTLWDVTPFSPEWRRSWFLETVHRDPFRLVTMGAGEGFSLASLTFGLGKTGKVVKGGVKTVIRKAPEFYGKFTKVFPEEKLVFESGRIVHINPMRRFVSKFGQTKTWGTMSRWSTGDIVKVRSLPYYDTIRYSDKGVTSRLDIYKGWGQNRWIPKSVLEQAQKTETFHIHKYTGWGTRYQSFVTEDIYKPRGHLWWKTAKKQITTFTEHEPMIRVFDPADVWEGFIRPGSKYSYIGLWKDTSGVSSLVHRPIHYRPMVSGGVHHAGYLTSSIPVTISTSETGSLLGMSLLSSLALKTQLKYKSELMYQTPIIEPVKRSKVDTIQSSMLGTKLLQLPISIRLQKSNLKLKSVEKYDISKESVGNIPINITPVSLFQSKIKLYPMFSFGGDKPKRRRKSFPFDYDVGYRFRLFESSKFKYRSPFKI